MKKNIAVISLKSQFCNSVCKIFCDKLEMLYADFNDILQYNLVNQNMLNTAGVDYFNTEEQKVLKSVVDCENVCLNINFEILNKNENLDLVKNNCLIIYLKHSQSQLKKLNYYAGKEQKKLLLAYDLEDKICCEYADIIVDATGDSEVDCEKMIKLIKKYYNLKD